MTIVFDVGRKVTKQTNDQKRLDFVDKRNYIFTAHLY